MRISSMYKKNQPVISFEIFPPKDKDLGMTEITKIIKELSILKPSYISVTYGAGGAGHRENTIKVSRLLKKDYDIITLPHLTCIDSTTDEIDVILERFSSKGIDNILALRGDTPEDYNGQSNFRYAKDLIKMIDNKKFCIGAAAYPEGHIDCMSADKNIEYLKEKIDAGAEFFISQLFFDNEIFYRFRDKLEKANIEEPCSAGIMPMLSQNQVQRMIFMCAASLPAKIIKILNKYQHSPEDLKKAGMEYVAEQARDLVENDVDGIHIYTMNRPAIAEACMGAINEYQK